MNKTNKRKIPLRKSARMRKVLANKKLREYSLPLWLIGLHIPLGILLYQSSALALVYPLFVFFLGLYWATQKKEKLENIAYIAAYLVGSEVLWRMSQSSIFWEFGKYSVSLIMIIALLQRGHKQIPKLPFLYFLLLLPSSLLTVMNNSFSEARGKLSFNLSGPLALFVCCWFFSHLKVDLDQLKKILLSLTLPVISVAVATLFYTVTTPDIQFTTESNLALSGGFGPNQVSSILGLGAFACITCFLIFKNDLKNMIYLGVFTVFFAAQSVMTFSRGGMYAALGAALAVAFFQMQNLSKTVKRVIPIVGLGLIFMVFIFPYMNDFTGGKLQERFEDKGTTNRFEIVESDFVLFFDNPILGTGVGEARVGREEILGYSSASHTEFTRVVSEHGILGILSLLALIVTAVFSLQRQKFSFGKALVGGVIVWSGLFMLNSGMRLAAPSFLWGLSFITIYVLQRKRPPRKFRKLRPPRRPHPWQTSEPEKNNEQ